MAEAYCGMLQRARDSIRIPQREVPVAWVYLRPVSYLDSQ